MLTSYLGGHAPSTNLSLAANFGSFVRVACALIWWLWFSHWPESCASFIYIRIHMYMCMYVPFACCQNRLQLNCRSFVACGTLAQPRPAVNNVLCMPNSIRYKILLVQFNVFRFFCLFNSCCHCICNITIAARHFRLMVHGLLLRVVRATAAYATLDWTRGSDCFNCFNSSSYFLALSKHCDCLAKPQQLQSHPGSCPKIWHN